jgi:diguanylate cyclase (GGDEF)-like protein
VTFSSNRARAAAGRGLGPASFNPYFVALMFLVIVAIGGCGVYALVLSQASYDSAASGDDRTTDARRMSSALDLEQAALLSDTRDHGVGRMKRFLDAGRMFDTALEKFAPDANPDEIPFVLAIRPLHAAFVENGRVIVAALARGDSRKARDVEAQHAWPKLASIRRTLDSVAAETLAINERDDTLVRQGTRRLMSLIAGVTIFGLFLMTGMAALLSHYTRSVETASQEKRVLEQAALTDNLTGLGNHRAFSEDFAREISRAKRNRRPLTLALIDVDDFKAVNDSRGHAHGDEVLSGVGRLLRSLREEDRAYRVGGDEFAVLLVETDAPSAQTVIQRLRNEARLKLSGATLSIGYVNLTKAQLDLEPYELADTALYEAKRRGRDTVVCFDEISDSVDVFSPRKAELVRRLIAEELVSVAFQPIWDIDSMRPLAFEALARPATELGLSGPQEAFDIAERIRQIYELDCVCIRKALESVPNLPAGSTLFLNVSPATFAHARFDPNAFVAQLRAAGVDPSNVVIELTERRVEDQAVIIQRARTLRTLGVRMALDDTGSGYAGLELLSKLRLDFVKIDRALLVQAIHDPGARGVLAGIIAIARETGSYLIAEGIESRELLDFACIAHAPGNSVAPGIRGVQGFLLGRPELGQVNVRALEQHHVYLAKHSLDGPAKAGAPKAA